VLAGAKNNNNKLASPSWW